MSQHSKATTTPKPQAIVKAPSAPYLVRYFDQTVHSQPFFSQADAEKFYASLPVEPEDKTLVRTTDNKVLL